jgi:SAM-dependent methyltransferase
MSAFSTGRWPAPVDFAAAASRALADPPPGVDPWFLSYCGELGTERGLRTFVRAKGQLLGLVGGVRGKDVLDAGSGFGMVSHLLAAWGARSVCALEVHGPMVDSHRRLRARYFPDHSQVRLLRGDASRLPLRDRSLDLVVSIEAVSHYADASAFLDECARVLRPGGHLLISDANNGANPSIRRSTEAFWERIELGPRGDCNGHPIEETMVERRERVLRERFPELEEDRVRALARLTSGLDRKAIERVVAAHLAGGPAPARAYRRGACPLDPLWGYRVEWLFEPRGLACELTNRGFDARAIPHYGGAGNDLLLVANSLLRLLPTFRFARGFRVVARRR